MSFPFTKQEKNIGTPLNFSKFSIIEKLGDPQKIIFFQKFEEVDIELAELRQRHNHTVEQMNKTVVDDSGDGDESLEERKFSKKKSSSSSNLEF